jgi:MoxR-like ATPase
LERASAGHSLPPGWPQAVGAEGRPSNGDGAPLRLSETTTAARRVSAAVERVIAGIGAAVEAAVICLLAEGNLLLEGVPGVGKTMLARAVARSVGGTFRRIQATPDLLPSDVTGVSVYEQELTRSASTSRRSSGRSSGPTSPTGHRRNRRSGRPWQRPSGSGIGHGLLTRRV